MTAPTKTIYFVRHGESEGNVGIFHQGPSTKLTEKGREQAHIIGERCAKLPLDAVISSTMKRTDETTKIIMQHVSKPLEYSDLFREWRRPSEQTDKPRNSPEAMLAEETIIKRFVEPGFRYSDEENFDDLKERARKALELLEIRKENRLLVVTHGLFMRVVVAYAIFGKDLSATVCDGFIRAFRTNNTGLTVMRFNEQNKRVPWEIWSWNDHAHLG